VVRYKEVLFLRHAQKRRCPALLGASEKMTLVRGKKINAHACCHPLQVFVGGMILVMVSMKRTTRVTLIVNQVEFIKQEDQSWSEFRKCISPFISHPFPLHFRLRVRRRVLDSGLDIGFEHFMPKQMGPRPLVSPLRHHYGHSGRRRVGVHLHP